MEPVDICISEEEYYNLLDDSVFLKCLMAAGVDSWEGYEYAQELMENEVVK